MPNHTVQPGECIATIAARYNFHDYRTIYEHARNAPLRRNRKNPNMLVPGDRVYVPPPEQRDEARSTTQLHQFQVGPNEAMLRIVLKNREGLAYANKRYELAIRNGSTLRGNTNGEGLIEQRVPADAVDATLTVWFEEPPFGQDGYEFRLKIGHLQPVTTDKGVQARLNNLGYPCGAIDGAIGRNTRAALRAFQAANEDLEQTGRADAATRQKLCEKHDGTCEERSQ